MSAMLVHLVPSSHQPASLWGLCLGHQWQLFLEMAVGGVEHER